MRSYRVTEDKMLRLLAATFTLALTIVAPNQEASASKASLAEQIVDSFNQVFGAHPGARATHAKGVVLEGTFTPASSAASVSKAVHFQKKKTAVPVTVRFSASTG